MDSQGNQPESFKLISIWKRPVLHYLVGGMLLFFFANLQSAPSYDELIERGRDEPIVITTGRVRQLIAQYTAQTGASVSRSEVESLVDRAVDEEVLYREGLTRGLHLYDRSVQHRLIQKMEFLTDHEVSDKGELLRQAVELDLARDDVVIKRMLTEKMRLVLKSSADVGDPTDAELQTYLEQHDSEYMHPERVTFDHVYFSRDKRGDESEGDAARVLTKLRTSALSNDEARDAGDAYAFGHEQKNRAPRSLAKIFGPTFVDAVFDLPIDTWSGPVESATGHHVVLIRERSEQRLPELDEVRRQVTLALTNERREAKYIESLAELRAEYDVQMESIDEAMGSDS